MTAVLAHDAAFARVGMERRRLVGSRGQCLRTPFRPDDLKAREANCSRSLRAEPCDWPGDRHCSKKAVDDIARVDQGQQDSLERRSPVVALIGPRQCGKTTLARELVATDSPNYFDLEDPAMAFALQNPMSALSSLTGLVVLDEAQRFPGLFPVLRVLADRLGQPATFLILGSASPELSRQASESLAGRVEVIELAGFHSSELSAVEQRRLWERGGFPRAFFPRHRVACRE